MHPTVGVDVLENIGSTLLVTPMLNVIFMSNRCATVISVDKFD